MVSEMKMFELEVLEKFIRLASSRRRNFYLHLITKEELL